jgi:hypothetical protein
MNERRLLREMFAAAIARGAPPCLAPSGEAGAGRAPLYARGSATASISPADLADQAKAMSAFIECE